MHAKQGDAVRKRGTPDTNLLACTFSIGGVMEQKNEVGRELTAEDLRELATHSIVVVRREDHATAVTLRLLFCNEMGAWFYGNEGNLNLNLLCVFNDGVLQDDTGKRIYVNEYLGTAGS